MTQIEVRTRSDPDQIHRSHTLRHPCKRNLKLARPPLEGEIIPPSPKGEIARTPLEIELEAQRIESRRALRTTAIALLRMSGEVAANIIQIIDILADVMLANDIITLAREWQKLKIEQQAVSDFIKKAPYSLVELQVRSPLGYEEFSR